MKRIESLDTKHFGLWLFPIYCIICFHFTEVKFAGVKLNELVSLLTVPFLISGIKSINKYLVYFLILFLSFLFITICLNLNTTFYLNLEGLSPLKLPYLISVSRFIELLACLSFALMIYKTINYYSNRGIEVSYTLRKVLNANFYISAIFLLVFLLTYLNILSLQNSSIVYDTTSYDPNNPTPRLRGFYVEGGPLGLFYAALYILTFFIKGRKWLLRASFLLVLLCSQSKAGIVAVLAWHFYLFYQNFKSAKWFRYVVLTALLPIFYLVFTMVIANYIHAVQNFSGIVAERQNDTNFVMGRIAAVFITPNMVMENPIFGVGLGNYALVRNNPDYLGILPPSKGWDAPGLGVFATLLVENGIYGLTLFILILYFMYRRYSRTSVVSGEAIKVFVLICLLGVQLHFLYIWFFIGLALAAPNDEIDS